MLFNIVIVLLIISGFALLFWFVAKKFSELQNSAHQSQQLEEMVNKVFGMSAVQIAQQSKQILQAEKETIQTDLSNKQRSIEKIVEQLKNEIDERQKEIRSLEQDRNKTFASVREAISQHQEITKELKTTTDALAKVLSNNQVRGSWGERIIEDLLRSSGLLEGIHFIRQQKLGETTDRPDITLLLPNKRIVPIDVKFPYSEMTKMVQAESKAQKDIHIKQFENDIKSKIKKVSQYIKPDQDTLEVAILFVPNEMVFSFINQNYPDLFTEAMRQRVMIASPYSLLSIIRIILESHRSFMMESNLRTIVKHIGEFSKEWERFIGEFDKFGDSIAKMDQSYRQIRETRHKQLTQRISKVQMLQEKEQIPLIEAE